jgi:hypothetical protein
MNTSRRNKILSSNPNNTRLRKTFTFYTDKYLILYYRILPNTVAQQIGLNNPNCVYVLLPNFAIYYYNVKDTANDKINGLQLKCVYCNATSRTFRCKSTTSIPYQIDLYPQLIQEGLVMIKAKNQFHEKCYFESTYNGTGFYFKKLGLTSIFTKTYNFFNNSPNEVLSILTMPNKLIDPEGVEKRILRD